MRLVTAIAAAAIAIGASSSSYAQATRTWVSGVGDDANPCSRTAPCKTFQGAYNKTAAGGEIDALDPAGYGTLVIQKSLTISGEGTLAGILSAGTTGITISAPGGVVVLRDIHINGIGTGIDGIRVIEAKHVTIEHSTIANVSRFGLWVNSMASAGSVVIKNSRFSNNVDAIRTTFGSTTVSNTVISGNSGFGLIAENSGVINADSNTLTDNSTAVQAGNGLAGQSAATVRISNNDVYNNLNGFVCAGGVIASDGSNRKGNNSGGMATPCTPNGAITKQ